MTEEPEYDPVDCPVADCEFSDVPRSVAAHVSGTDDADHDWDRLQYDGARAFVMDAKLQQLDAMGAEVPGASADRSYDPGTGSATTDDATATDASSGADDESAGADRESAGAVAADRESAVLDTTFVDDAVAVVSLLRRYGTRDVASLDPFRLANLYALLSDLDSAAGDARTQVRDVLLDEIQDDREVAAEFGEIKRYTRESQRLKDDRTVRDALERAGVDPADATSLDSGKVEELVESGRLAEDAVFDVETKPLVRRVSVAADRRDDLLAELDPELRDLLTAE